MKKDEEADGKSTRDAETGLADGRRTWEWKTRFPAEAWKQIWREAAYLVFCLTVFGLTTVLSAAYVPEQVGFDFHCVTDVGDPTKQVCSQFSFTKTWLACYFAGSLGGTVLTIKWLIHSVGTGKWHQDRVFWRLFVPWIGGVYSVIIHGLANSGLIGGQTSGDTKSLVTVISIAFLVGLFSDGVSGLLTNVANAVFGTVIEKK